MSSGALRGHPELERLQEAGAAHLKAIGAMKKEFDKLRDVWLTQREVLYRTDELLMAEMRTYCLSVLCMGDAAGTYMHTRMPYTTY